MEGRGGALGGVNSGSCDSVLATELEGEERNQVSTFWEDPSCCVPLKTSRGFDAEFGTEDEEERNRFVKMEVVRRLDRIYLVMESILADSGASRLLQ